MRTPQASKQTTGHPPDTRNGGRRPSASDTKTAPNPINPRHTRAHTQRKQGAARDAPCCRWPPRRRHLRAAGTARTPPPPPARTTSPFHPRPPAPQIGRPRATGAAALDPGQPQPPIWRASERRRLGFGFWAAARRRKWWWYGEGRGRGGEESDRGGSAVNAMAAMALSVFPFLPPLPLVQVPSSCGLAALEALGRSGGLALYALSLRKLSQRSE